MQARTAQRRWLASVVVIRFLGIGSGLALSQGAERQHGAEGTRHEARRLGQWAWALLAVWDAKVVL
jgi:hypothetical protein